MDDTTVFSVAWATPVLRERWDNWYYQDETTAEFLANHLAFPHARLLEADQDFILVGISALSASPDDVTRQLQPQTAEFLATSSQRARETWRLKAKNMWRRVDDEVLVEGIQMMVDDLLAMIAEHNQFKLYKVVSHVPRYTNPVI